MPGWRLGWQLNRPSSSGPIGHVDPLSTLGTLRAPARTVNAVHGMQGRTTATERNAPHTCDTRGPDCDAPGRIRTCDTRFRKPVLYPLSYEG